MRVSKQTLSEWRLVLYGEKAFRLRRSTWPKIDELDHYPNQIPCMPYKNGNPQHPRKMAENLERMFSKDKETKLSKFVARNGMLHFTRRIGSVNTALLTKVTIKGIVIQDCIRL